MGCEEGGREQGSEGRREGGKKAGGLGGMREERVVDSGAALQMLH